MTRSEPPAEVIDTDVIVWKAKNVAQMCHRPLEYPAGNDEVARTILGLVKEIERLRASSSLGGIEGEELARPQTACAPDEPLIAGKPHWLRDFRTYSVGEKAFIWSSGHQGDMSEGTVIAVIDLPGYQMPHYIISLPTGMDDLLAIRSGSVLEMRREWHKAEGVDDAAEQGLDGNPAREPQIAESPAGALTAEKAASASDIVERLRAIGEEEMYHEPWTTRCDLREAADRLERVDTLFAAIAHGDDKHRAWLREAIDAHFAGSPLPPVVNVQAPVAGIRSEPPSSARERRMADLSLKEVGDYFADMADYNLTCWDAYGDGPIPEGVQKLYELGKQIRAALSSDGRGREKGNTSNSADGIDPAPPATESTKS